MKIKPFYAASLLFIYSSSAFALAAGEACSSQGSTAHTGSSSGGVSLMCNGSTWVEIVSYDTAGKAHFKKPVEGITPVNNKDIATKEYVDNAVASASGGGGGGSAFSPLVFTKKEYTGNHGGQSGGDAKCAQEYPGYHMCMLEDFALLTRTGRMPDPKPFLNMPLFIVQQIGWSYGDNYYNGDTYYVRNNDGYENRILRFRYYDETCSKGTSSSGSFEAMTAWNSEKSGASGWGSNSFYCRNSFPLACCKVD